MGFSLQRTRANLFCVSRQPLISCANVDFRVFSHVATDNYLLSVLMHEQSCGELLNEALEGFSLFNEVNDYRNGNRKAKLYLAHPC